MSTTSNGGRAPGRLRRERRQIALLTGWDYPLREQERVDGDEEDGMRMPSRRTCGTGLALATALTLTGCADAADTQVDAPAVDVPEAISPGTGTEGEGEGGEGGGGGGGY